MNIYIAFFFFFFFSCSYDYLEVYESASSNDSNSNESARRFCGDWSDKLKLLRYVSSGPRLYLRFISDYSHSFSGYKAHVSIEQGKFFNINFDFSIKVDSERGGEILSGVT